MGGQIENRPKSNYKKSPLLCRLGLHSASSVQWDEPFFKLDREAPFRESPLLPVLGGGITVASLSVRRVDVEGGYTRLHVSDAGPSQQVILVGSHRAARTLSFHILLCLPFGCVSVPSRAPRRCGPTLSLISRHHSRLGGLFNDNIEATLTRGRLPRLLQAKELLQPEDTLLVGMEVPPAGVQPLLESFLSLSPLFIIPSTGQQLDLIPGASLFLRGGPLERSPYPGGFLGPL